MSSMNADMLPMLAGKSYQAVPAHPVNDVAEVKLDGWRTIVHIENGTVHLYGGRNGSDYTGRVPYIEDAVRHLPPDTVLDGELVSPGNWGMVQSIMTTQQPHKPSVREPALWLYVFDMLRLNGYDTRHMRWSERRRLIDVMPADNDKQLRVTQLVPATQETLQAALNVGFEGLVIKDPDSRYVNKRSNAWEKVKPQVTTEARIIGFKEGKADGAWAGMVGAFEVELLENGAHTTVKCGTDARHIEATREWRSMTYQHERWLGAIIEIKHHGLGKDGVPRHPQFSRRREDLE